MLLSPSADREVDLVVLQISNRNASTATLIFASTKRTILMGWSLTSPAKTGPPGPLVVALATTEVLLGGTHGGTVAALEDEITIDTAVDRIVAVRGAEIHGESEIATEMTGTGDDNLVEHVK